MALRYGKCTNYGLCVKADTKEAQTVPDGAEFVCVDCRRPLTAVFGSAQSSGVKRSMVLVAIALLMGIGAAVWTYRLVKARSDGAVPGSASDSQPLPGKPTLRLSGSNTIGAQLGPALAEAWLGKQGAANIRREHGAHEDETWVEGTANGKLLLVEVKAHGSATAFTDLGSAGCDIGMASRKIKPGEAAVLQSKGLGDLTTNANEKVLGLDGVAIVVNDASSSDTMTKEDAAGIFAGTSSGAGWHIYARDDKSGTYDTFKDRVLGSRSLSPSAKRFEDSRELVRAVAGDRNGIGFVGLPYAVGVKVVAIAERGAMALVPNAMTVRTESYALSRRLYLYVPETATPEARDFVRFALSPAGQDIVDKSGFVGQKIEIMTAPPDVKLMPGSDRLSVDFRFRPGSSTLDTKAMDDVVRVASSVSSQYDGRGIMLIGFADNTGTPAGNLALSKSRAQAVAQLMQRHGINAVFITGFGQELPVADNSTEDGREKNRRVEVWLRK